MYKPKKFSTYKNYEIHKDIHVLTSLSSSILVQSRRCWNYDAVKNPDKLEVASLWLFGGTTVPEGA